MIVYDVNKFNEVVRYESERIDNNTSNYRDLTGYEIQLREDLKVAENKIEELKEQNIEMLDVLKILVKVFEREETFLNMAEFIKNIIQKIEGNRK